jgi:hypothetical protein
VSVLLAPDTVELYPPGPAEDSHGWALPTGDQLPTWSGPGSLQLAAGPSDPQAAQGGGAGPFDPAAADAGSLYLPPDAVGATEGALAVVRGRAYALSQVRLVTDPTGGPLSCVVATVSGLDGWPPDG